MDTLMALIESLKWPFAVLGCVYILRKPLGQLIQNMRSAEYEGKNGKFQFSFAQERLNESKERLEIEDAKPQEAEETVIQNPRDVVLVSWKQLEAAAEKKLSELGVDLKQKGFKSSALSYLDYKGAFPPQFENSLQDMRMLRNQIAHPQVKEVPVTIARDYQAIAKKIRQFIENLHILPLIQLHAMTMIQRNLLHLIDSGQYQELSIDEVHQKIEDGTILNFIAKLKGAGELNGFLNSDAYKGFDKFYIGSLQSLYYAYAGDERRKWGIENSGLCLLAAWTNEIIQMGSGWHPEENLSHLDEPIR